MPFSAQFWGIWKFAQNKPAAKDLIIHLSQTDLVRERVTAVEGYDLPPFASMVNFPIWSEVGPPTGTVFNYPLRKVHDSIQHVAAYPAPPEVGVRIYQRGTMPTMVAKLTTGTPLKDVLSWAENELEGFMR